MSEAWRPSNGTEGELFQHHRCRTCVNDRFDFTTLEGDSCPIWMNALMHVDDIHLYWDADAKRGECDMYYPTSAAQAAGLDAARDAVAAVPVGRDVRFSADVRADALAAIDGILKGEQA